MNCKQFYGMISEYMDGGMDGAVAEQAEKHLGTCAKCARLVQELENTSSLVRSLDRPAAPAGFEARLETRLSSLRSTTEDESTREAAPGRRGLRAWVANRAYALGSILAGARPAGRRLALRSALALVLCVIVVASVLMLVRDAQFGRSDVDWAYIETCRRQHAAFAAANPLADESAVMLRERARDLGDDL